MKKSKNEKNTSEKNEGNYVNDRKFELTKKSAKTYSKYTIGRKILLVDGDKYSRSSLARLLKDDYIIIEAADGNEGFRKALKFVPDLIITNILLPTINGFDLCFKIKKNAKLLNIPVIMYSEKQDKHSEDTCLKLGAEAFIVKPFDNKEIVKKIRLIIRLRSNSGEDYNFKVTNHRSESIVKKHNEIFLGKFINLVEENINNPALDVKFIADRMNLSHSSLYRKTKEMNGTSVIELISQVRIDKAVQLLKENRKTLTQIAAETGFSDLKQFRLSFQKQLKMTPKEFRDRLN